MPDQAFHKMSPNKSWSRHFAHSEGHAKYQEPPAHSHPRRRSLQRGRRIRCLLRILRQGPSWQGQTSKVTPKGFQSPCPWIPTQRQGEKKVLKMAGVARRLSFSVEVSANWFFLGGTAEYLLCSNAWLLCVFIRLFHSSCANIYSFLSYALCFEDLISFSSKCIFPVYQLNFQILISFPNTDHFITLFYFLFRICYKDSNLTTS